MNKISYIRYIFLLISMFTFGCATVNDLSFEPVANEKPLNIPADSSKKVVLYIAEPTNMQQWRGIDSYKGLLNTTFAKHAKEVNVEFATQDNPKPTGETGTLIKFSMNSHSEVGGYFRLGGVSFAHIYSKVTFINLNNGNIFGEHTYNVLMSPAPLNPIVIGYDEVMIDTIATKVFSDIENSKNN